MKYITIFFLMSLSIYCQDIIDPLSVISDTTANYSNIKHDQERFLIGWNWGNAGRNIDNALNVNFYHAYPKEGQVSDDEYADSILVSQNADGLIIGGRLQDSKFNSESLLLEPTIDIRNIDDLNSFVPTLRNRNGAVFGFQTKRKIKYENDPLHPDFGRVKLMKDSVLSGHVIVLDSIWPDNKLRYYQYAPVMNKNYMNGKQLYISINLKSLEPISNSHPDSVVLTIRLPYKVWKDSANKQGRYIDSNYVKFRNIPINTGNVALDTSHIRGARGDFRGVKRKNSSTLSHSPGTREFKITAGMLYADHLGLGNKNITLSAFSYFGLLETGINNWNPLLEPDYHDHGDDTVYIKNLGVEVKYHGNLDIAIDWIRLETPRAKEIFEGKYDLDVYEYATDILDELANETWRDPNAFRFYAADEIKMHQWGINRYYNMLLDTLASSEVAIHENPAALYNFALDFKEIWTGDNLSYNVLHAPPFIKYSVNNDSSFTEGGVLKHTSYSPESLNYRFGFKGKYLRKTVNSVLDSETLEYPLNDSLNSNYETFLYSSSSTTNLPLPDNINPFENLYEPYYDYSVQYFTEFLINKNYKGQNFMLYGDKHWWANLWINSENWENASSINSNTLDFWAKRPKTGEEISLMTNLPLILGTKGLIYWKKMTNTNGNDELGLTPQNQDSVYLQSLDTGETLIYSDIIGGDFKRYVSEANSIISGVDDSKLRLDMFGHNNKRIYIGLKSTRSELYKLHKWINVVEDELLDLRLKAWHSKGYKEFDEWSQQGKYKYWQDSPLHLVVNVDSIRTRKLFEPKHTLIHNTVPDYESRDSSFFDITLLQDKRDTPNDLYNRKKSVYLGILNRRTDPLIYRDSIDTITLDSLRELMFFSSAEMDSNVRYGGKDLWGVQQNGDWWQDQWWKRLGARELRLPINIPVYGNGTYMIAEELGLDTLNSIGWWYADSLYHKVDTLLLGGDNLFAKLLPGQGKIIKLTYVPYFFNDPTKDSDTTNDYCYFCDIYNDKEMFEFSVVAGSETGSSCCYDVSFKYNGDCEFEDIPFRLLFTKDSITSFTDDIIELHNPNEIQDSLDLKYKYKDTVMSLNSETGIVDLGTFCLADSAIGYTISLLAGKDKNNKFIGCDREMSFKVACDYSDKEIKDCCENLLVTDTEFTIGSDPKVSQYCTTLKVSTGFDSDCIYGVTLGNGNYKRTLDSIKSSPIDFTTGSGKEYTLCSGILNCAPGSPPSSQFTMVKMQFLGKDGTVICEVDVSIWLPCIYTSLGDLVLDPGGPVGPAKSANDKQDSKTYESDSFKVTIWPNPTSGELNVEIDSKIDTEVDINFISNIGANLTNENGVTINKGVNEKTYNLKNYSSGVYYLQINGKDGNIVLPILLNK